MKKSFSFFVPLGIALALTVVLKTTGQRTVASAADAPAPNPILSTSSLPLQEARVIIDAAVAFARNQNMRMAVVVLDD